MAKINSNQETKKLLFTVNNGALEEAHNTPTTFDITKFNTYFSYPMIHVSEQTLLYETSNKKHLNPKIRYFIQSTEQERKNNLYKKWYKNLNVEERLDNPILKVVSKLVKDNEFSIKLIEDCIIFRMLLDGAFNGPKFDKKKIIFAIITYSKLRSENSLIQEAIKSKLILYVDIFFEALREYSIQSFESTLGTMRETLNKYDVIKESELSKKLYKLIMYGLSLSLFEKIGITMDSCGYTTMEQALLKKKYYLNADFVRVVLDSVLFICERGFQMIKTGRFESLFHSGNTYMDFYDRYAIIKRQSMLLTNPEAHGFKESTFRAELDDLIEIGTGMQKHCMKISEPNRKILFSLVNELQFIRCELCTKRAAREHRKAPFSILIFGESGIGKSTIKDLFFYQHAKIKGLEADSSFCYTRNPVANFWDGFTTSQHTVILDDVAAIHPNKAPNGDPSMMELIQIINSVPFVPDQADLTNKGRTPLKCEFVIATSNVKTLNAQYYFSHASAVQRRLPFIITPTVKKEFARKDGTLDADLTTHLDDEYPDLWIWKVEKVNTRLTTDQQKLADLELILETDNVITMLKWFNKAVLDFDKNQLLVADSINKMKKVQICNLCLLPVKSCECEIQSVEFDTTWISYFLTWLFNFIVYLCQCWIINKIDIMLCRIAAYLVLRAYVLSKLTLKTKCRIMRQRFYNMGEQVKKNIGYPAILAGITIALTSAMVIHHLYKTLHVQSKDVMYTDKGSKPKNANDKQENVWYKDDFKLSHFHLTSQITSTKGMTIKEFTSLIQKNLVYFMVKNRPGKIMEGRAFCIKGQYYITNNHLLPVMTEPKMLKIVMQHSTNGICENIDVYISESQIQRFPQWDMLVLRIPNIPPKKDLTSYFISQEITLPLPGFIVGRKKTGEIYENLCSKFDNTCLANNNCLPNFDNSICSTTPAFPTINGDCGSIYVLRTPMGFAIAGIHMLGNPDYCMAAATRITKQQIDQVNMDNLYSIQSGHPKLSSETAKRDLTSLHPKSVLRYIEKGSAEVYGSFNGFRPTHSSAVEVTPIAHHLDKYGYKITKGAPVMKGWEPWRIAALDMLNPVVLINNDILEKCVEGYINDVLKSGLDLSEVQIYDDFTAINGANGVAYVDKINRNTSAGNPWKKVKSYFMQDIPPAHGLMNPVKVDDEIMNRAHDIIKTYEENERAHPVFCAHLKDEPTSFKKIKQGKTRVFTGAPFDWSIVVRKYYLSCIRLMQKNRYIFEAASGIVAQSRQWHELYEFLVKHGKDRIVCGDYKSFDKSMNSQFILAAFKILIKICEASGNYDSRDVSVLCGIAQDTANPLVDFNGDLVQFYGSNPSGHPLTVIINSLVNSLYMRYAYYVLNPDKEVNSFKNRVSLMTYGDDNIMGVSPEINWYNHTSISKAFASMGIIYTMADKEAESIPYVPIDDATFLKRSWRYEEELGCFVCPLDHESIEKTLMVWVRSKSISQEQHCMEQIGVCVSEYFFYGRDIFEMKKKLLQKIVEEMNLKAWITEQTFPHWDQLIDRFEKSAN